MELIDPNVLTWLPEGTEVTNVQPWGASGWTQTMRVTTTLPSGEEKEYFLKDCAAEFAEAMFSGEYHSLERMYTLMPTACPKPRGWGKYQSSANTYFVIMDFLYLIAEPPDPKTITKMIADLHRTTAGTSPDNKFGFDVPTCHGKISQPNEWDSDWCRYFSRLLTVFYDEDMKVNGPFPEYENAFKVLKERVIPRLLRPLQSDGRVLTPCLIHGDLWHENIGLNEETEEPMLYDPALFYGHNEFEMGMWRTSFVPFDDSYRMNYFIQFPPSEPVTEWDDRNRLYSIFFHLSHSAHWTGAAIETRLRTLEDMSFLIQKYDSPLPVKDIDREVELNNAAFAANNAAVSRNNIVDLSNTTSKNGDCDSPLASKGVTVEAREMDDNAVDSNNPMALNQTTSPIGV
ncbi:Fructosamine kinase-domain-containing protein [Xylariaceae sp. FL0255]|nr:Fructosamine kinase-domain-containing protein [Xylariaceae sp. FL0255]